MNYDLHTQISLTTPADLLTELRTWVRTARQREGWTLSDLASRSGVPVATLSRWERTGQASLDTATRVLSALGLADTLAEFLKERQRLAGFPKDLEKASPQSAGRARQRVRHKREKV